jgi:hypothetical protein
MWSVLSMGPSPQPPECGAPTITIAEIAVWGSDESFHKVLDLM